MTKEEAEATLEKVLGLIPELRQLGDYCRANSGKVMTTASMHAWGTHDAINGLQSVIEWAGPVVRDS
jgi:hypothetical protein